MKHFLDYVKIYWNSNKRLFSVMHKGKVIAHAYSFELFEVTYKVNANGRDKVRSQKRKNVHAYICGRLIDLNFDAMVDPDARQAHYNPYQDDRFKDNDGNYIDESLSCIGIITEGKPVIWSNDEQG